ncbi:hypothetical protein UFOVP1604_214 [uncultured Caudovirales phage]|uniref:Uncharacterized protein n=1 Tax=uncultured Caudovirales phage TaxID=2100421 RepID=A0A6J5SWX6_9CAUD|nr:hypothetical protein UFOVP1604_214 [uncultured Caudovirales phage]
MVRDYIENEELWIKKYKDIDRKGVTSTHWKEVLDVIGYLEYKENYEGCQELWDYYKEITNGRQDDID